MQLEVSDMALIRWEPARSVFDVQAGHGAARRWVPAIDLLEEGDHYVLRADLPGVEEKDVNVEVADRVLTVSGERRTQSEQHGEGYRRFERASGSFRRALRLPDGTDPASVKASFENGVLEVQIPKPQERLPRRVEINAPEHEPVLEGASSAS
jgi:HSP20 family protein